MTHFPIDCNINDDAIDHDAIRSKSSTFTRSHLLPYHDHPYTPRTQSNSLIPRLSYTSQHPMYVSSPISFRSTDCPYLCNAAASTASQPPNLKRAQPHHQRSPSEFQIPIGLSPIISFPCPPCTNISFPSATHVHKRIREGNISPTPNTEVESHRLASTRSNRGGR